MARELLARRIFGGLRFLCSWISRRFIGDLPGGLAGCGCDEAEVNEAWMGRTTLGEEEFKGRGGGGGRQWRLRDLGRGGGRV